MEIIAMQGCPGSGKSRVAKQLLAAGFEYISLDDIRYELTGNAADQSRNADVVKIMLLRVEMLLRQNKSIIIDSTMTKREYLAPIEALAQKYGAQLSILFVRVKLATALSRNAQRDRVVPADIVEIIYNMIAHFDYSGLKVTVVDNE